MLRWDHVECVNFHKLRSIAVKCRREIKFLNGDGLHYEFFEDIAANIYDNLSSRWSKEILIKDLFPLSLFSFFLDQVKLIIFGHSNLNPTICIFIIFYLIYLFIPYFHFKNQICIILFFLYIKNKPKDHLCVYKYS